MNLFLCLESLDKMDGQITVNTPLKSILKVTPPCSCDACKHGCTVGSGFLIDSDKEKIAKYLKITEEKLEKKYLESVDLYNKKHFRPKIKRKGKPYGPCTFFDKKKGLYNPCRKTAAM